MVFIDSNTNLIFFEYNPDKGFDYEDFLKQMTPLMPELFVQDGDLGPKEEGMIETIDYADYSNEVEEMFERMKINELDGQTKFIYSKPFEYIEAVVHWTVRDKHNIVHDKYDRFPVEVDGHVIIYPKGLRIIN